MAEREVVMAKRPTTSANSPPTNQLLAALPLDDYARIAPSLDIIPMKLRQTLHKAGEPVEYVYFPGGGFVSLLTVLEDGTMVEVATIGREGMIGLPAALNSDPSPSETFVQGESELCWRMPTPAFRREVDRRGALHELVSRYNHALFGVVMQSTACNAIHSVKQRLARWLLTAQDRMQANDFPLTQEFLAMMLGATRPMITVVARTLQKAGLIRYHRGHVTIVDRRRLEAASCECYRASANLLRRVTAKPVMRRGSSVGRGPENLR
jgi:CRP-like cAMP-binding protein